MSESIIFNDQFWIVVPLAIFLVIAFILIIKDMELEERRIEELKRQKPK